LQHERQVVRLSQVAGGHRERKKQRTREAIERAALELFVERGYDATTLAEIAEAAGVSARTIFAYFPSKEDILFSSFQAMRDTLARALAERPGDKDALGTVRDFVLGVACVKTELDLELEQLVAKDETLLSHKRARLSQLQELLAAAIADDLGSKPDDLRPHIAAASLTAAFEVLARHDRASPPPYSEEEIAAEVDPVIAFVRAGLEALPAPSPQTRGS
jgi:AcrR family transcriptional regulator